ncbi:DedA family protein [Hydrogenimonas cancrithermarum]|uniref:Membrane protein n=1 Tax=Hydrogenimonas cancrithermarum TaxID=2993563 RepID=A0ABN6WZW7_9BACT|nr:DedA family protein [Hydrogenimonas cancrithermarum]BDY13952.1 membrane protein [Hydrogenimonas cancrithermarum]
MEAFLLHALTEYGYIILFVWSIMEGELGLVMAGTMVHTGHMNMSAAIFVAGLGGFVGDQIYFYIGRYNKKWIHQYLHNHRRKFALAHLLLKKYGWPVIFIQRYLYGLRTIIPMSIGLTRYDAKKFAIINFISAQVWAAITIVLAYIFGEQILEVLEYTKEHWYFALPMAGLFFGGIVYTFKRIEKNILQRRKERYENRNNNAAAK